MNTTLILNVPVSLVNLGTAIHLVLGWVREGVSNYVCVRDVHGLMRAQKDAELMEIHRRAGMVTPDGMPLVWISRARGNSHVGRVCGADLVDALCGATCHTEIKHYFYGGKEGVAQRMVATLTQAYPGLKVAGTYCPPFRMLSPEEDENVVRKIVESQASIVWVGLSTPKQEYWMKSHVDRLPGATLIGVGAAFDFYAGDVRRAPKWMRNTGLEWLHRLSSEPRRLWRRYLLLAPEFLYLLTREKILMAISGRR